MKDGSLLACIDLGSNSFRLEIGRLDHNQIIRTEYLKETVRLGNGLDGDLNLTEEAQNIGFDCLARFAERLQSFSPSSVRVVATQTLREARNRKAFIERAQEILGFNVEVISGREEARLIYSGVSHFLPQTYDKRLVIDIGGRSTEIITGKGHKPNIADSFKVGSVDLSMQYFSQKQWTAKTFDKARIAAIAILEEALSFVKPGYWNVAYGSAGTIWALLDIVQAKFPKQKGLKPAHLSWLEEMLCKGHIETLKVPGLKDDRRPIIGGGLVIVQALFELFGLERLYGVRGSLRHGVLYDMLSRESKETDTRRMTMRRLQKRYGVDLEQARRVHVAAKVFLKLLLRKVDLEQAMVISWASELHEIGMSISHANYHRHGAYILKHADAPGFSDQELNLLSILVLSQRGGLKKVRNNLSNQKIMAQVLALRLAVIFCHARCSPLWNGISASNAFGGYAITLSQEWVSEYPQTLFLLEEESRNWEKIKRRLTITVE